MTNVSIDEDVFKRLQAAAIPLQDTVSSVIARILDFYDKHRAAGGGDVNDEETAELVAPIKEEPVIKCDPAAPVSLRHAVPDKIVIDGTEVAYNMRYWNTLLIEVIKLAAAKNQASIFDLVTINRVPGERSENNFVYIKEADLSIQLQNSDAAWKATYHIATKAKISIEVDFHWNQKDNAVHPGRRGTLAI